MSRPPSRGAGAFVVLGVAWALLVPFGLWLSAASRVGGAETVTSLLLRVVLASGAFWIARRLRIGSVLPGPPTALAAGYAALAVASVFHGLSHAASARSELGFLKLGSEVVSASALFPDLYYARQVSGFAQGMVVLAASALVIVSIIAAIAVARTPRAA